MLYQKIFTDEKPYHITLGHLTEFPEHRHADFELNFCVKDEFDITVEKRTYHIREGEAMFIPPMCSHSIPSQEREQSVLTLIAGMSLLKKYFKDFFSLLSEPFVCKLDTPDGMRARDLLYESASLKCAGEPCDELWLCGNVYKIMAYMFKVLSGNKTSAPQPSDYLRVENVEKALEFIHYNYKEALSIEYVAEAVGYSKSNFCKIFKRVVGESFHRVLNRRRAECAAGLLTVTSMSVTEISAEVGFSEPKAFCRVFKSIYGISPGQYRRMR